MGAAAEGNVRILANRGAFEQNLILEEEKRAVRSRGDVEGPSARHKRVQTLEWAQGRAQAFWLEHAAIAQIKVLRVRIVQMMRGEAPAAQPQAAVIRDGEKTLKEHAACKTATAS